MSSKLKLVVDYKCEVFCDFKQVGTALPGEMFILELRRGKYLLEFKQMYICFSGSGECFQTYETVKALDYEMISNDEDDLIKISLSKSRTYKCLNIRDNVICRSFEPYYTSREMIRLGNQEPIDIAYNDYTITTLITSSFPSDLVFSFKDRDETVHSIRINTNLYLDTRSIEIETFWYKEKSMLIVYFDGQPVIYNIKGDKVLSAKRLSIEAYLYVISDDLALVRKDSMYGIFDLSQNTLICDIQYEEIFKSYIYDSDQFKAFFSSETYVVKQNDRYGLMKKNGSIIIPCDYDGVYESSFGNILHLGNKWALLSNENEISDWYDDIYGYELGTWGYGGTIRLHGSSHYHYILCYAKDGKYGYWDYFGEKHDAIYDEIIIDASSYTIEPSNGGYLCLIGVSINGQVGYIDKYGQHVIDCKYDSLQCRPEYHMWYINDVMLYKKRGIITAELQKKIQQYLVDKDYIRDYGAFGDQFVDVAYYHDYTPIYIETCRSGLYGICVVEVNGNVREVIPPVFVSCHFYGYSSNPCFIVSEKRNSQELFGVVELLRGRYKITTPCEYSDRESLMGLVQYRYEVTIRCTYPLPD